MREEISGWGRTSPVVADVHHGVDSDEVADLVRTAGSRGVLARGMGRSYGDAAQNAGGVVIEAAAGRIAVGEGWVEAAAGTSLHELYHALIPKGLMPPVSPGTRMVSVAGALAADVHGKNHHTAGSFADHVLGFRLVGPDGQERELDRDDPLFALTAGGMGLTGVITSVKLRPAVTETSYVVADTERVDGLATLMVRMREVDRTHPHSVAWIDLVARGKSLGRGVLSSGRMATRADLAGHSEAIDPLVAPADPRLSVPVVSPISAASRPAVRAFNLAWFHKAPRHRVDEIVGIAPFFHPLDGIGDWNRLYGRRGFVQYQFAVPDDAAGEAAVVEAVDRIARNGAASNLSVLKRFGPGNGHPLSFPIAGWTLALDLPAERELAALLDDLDELVIGAGGRVYLAKDGRLSRSAFDRMYPGADELRSWRRASGADRVFVSDLSRRLGL